MTTNHMSYFLSLLLANQRISDKLYTTLQSNHYCSRRLNATHQVGCQSDLGGNLGVVWIIEDSADLDHVLKTGETPPYMAVLMKSLLSKKVILEFKNNPGRVSGVVFLDKEHDDSRSRSTPFSPDDICPNRYSGLYVNDTEYGDCKHAWQEESPVSGLLYEDIPFPIFMINEKKSIDSIESCFKDNNVIISESKDDKRSQSKIQASYPLCGVQLDSFMMAAKDSHFCLNSHFLIDEILQTNSRRCYPVDNQNVFAYYKPAIGPLHPINNTDTQKPDVADPHSVVLLVAKLSSISMFSEISPGADSTITSIISLLAIAEALGRVRNSTDVLKSKRNIAFAIIDSEPFDYTGSNRILQNMLQGAFPYSYYHSNHSNAIQNLNLSSIDYMINLDQMANYPSSESLHFHSDPRESGNNLVKLDKIFKVMQRLSSKMNVKLERESNLPLPPTSLQEFIRQSRLSGNENDKIAGLVLSNYGKTYKNLLYHSVYDDSHNIYQTSRAKLLQHLVQVSELIARTVYEITFEVNPSDELKVDSDIVDQLLDCYLKDAQCHLFTRACRAGQKMPSGPIPTYKDPTRRSDDMNGAITANLLAYFTGEKLKELNFSKCHDENYASLIYSYQYINDRNDPIDDVSLGVCIRSQVLMLSSDSPAYAMSNDEITIDPKYPAWTVSLSSIRTPVRLYLIPSPVSQWCLFLLGIIVTLASFVIVYYVRDNLDHSRSRDDLQTATPT